jgi:flagellar basal body-associated protein FliL
MAKQRTGKWAGIIGNVKAYIKRPKGKEGLSSDDEKSSPEAGIDDEEALETDSTNDIEPFEEDEAEDRQLAEATIISEDGSETNEGLEPEGRLDDDEDSLGSLDKNGIEKESEARPSPLVYASRIKSVFKHNRSAIGGLALGILLLLLLNGLRVMYLSHKAKQQTILPVQAYLASVQEGETTSAVLYLERFLILLVDEDDQAYLSLRIAITPSNKTAYEEVDNKRTICRAAIYETLKKAVRMKQELMNSKQKLKQDVMDSLNSILGAGTVHKVHLTEFLVI